MATQRAIKANDFMARYETGMSAFAAKYNSHRKNNHLSTNQGTAGPSCVWSDAESPPTDHTMTTNVTTPDKTVNNKVPKTGNAHPSVTANSNGTLNHACDSQSGSQQNVRTHQNPNVAQEPVSTSSKNNETSSNLSKQSHRSGRGRRGWYRGRGGRHSGQFRYQNSIDLAGMPAIEVFSNQKAQTPIHEVHPTRTTKDAPPPQSLQEVDRTHPVAPSQASSYAAALATQYKRGLTHHKANFAHARQSPATNLATHTVSNPYHYEVPKLGSERMPLLRLRPMPVYKSMAKQIEQYLPPAMQAVPSPKYRFSKKEKVMPDPAQIGAMPNPPPLPIEAPRSNNLDPNVAKGFAQARARVPKEGYAASNFDQELAEGDFCIVGETAAAASRWAWFVKPDVSERSSVNGDDTVLDYQLTDCDKHVPAYHIDGTHGNFFMDDVPTKVDWVSRWMCKATANTLLNPFCVDTNSEEFRSGSMPVSGLRFDYQEYPSDLSYRPVQIYYGPIDWDLLPEPKLNEPLYLKPENFNQTSEREVQIKVAEYQRRIKANETSKKPKLHKKRHQHKEDRPFRGPIDTSKMKTRNNTWAVGLKVYVRPAQQHDIAICARIYNHYVINSIDAPETMIVDEGAMRRRLQQCHDECYPFLVAVLRTEYNDQPVHKALKKNQAMDGKERTETVVGFVRIRSLSGNIDSSCFKGVAQMETFVSPQYTGHHIATNLIDRALGCVDLDYKSRQGVEIVVGDHRGKWTNHWRRPRNIQIKIFYEDAAHPSFMSRQHFFESNFQFKEVGNMVGMCTKDGVVMYSMLTMSRETNRI